MKSLIPSHRENKRYLLISGKNLKKEVIETIKEFIGILGITEASPIWIKIKTDKGILSINRKSLNKVRASFAVSKKDFKVLKVSGSLKGLK
ncbi:MAG: hypothetical protein U9Q99_00545 [Nanoarchaeota archaeon]|nr:hypothetical protein [Nanoarchaeota archaeon]